MRTLFQGMPRITSPEVFELVCRLFKSFEPKVAGTGQIFSFRSPLPTRILLKKGLQFLKGLGVSASLIEAVSGPKQGRFRNRMGRSFLIGLAKKLMSFLIDTVFQSDPSAGI
jgi:hypothetical protein